VDRGEGEVIGGGGGKGEVIEEKEGKRKVFGGGRGEKTEEKEEKTGVRRKVVGEGKEVLSVPVNSIDFFGC
jgi:hypothetical protein